MSGNDRSSWDSEAQNKHVSARPQGRNFLLLIGIDTYAHFPKLENARGDTEAFRELLQRKYQFEPDHTIELFDDQATRRNILRALDGLTEQLTSDDNLLIYYAGHGYHRKRLNIGYFVPSEAETGAFEMLISNTTIRDYVRAFDAHHILLIVDSCFSGSLLHRDAEMVKAFAEKVDRFSSRWGLAAGMIEKVADGTVGSHSPFAKSLLHYLEQNTAPRLPISELIQYVSKITTYNADQTPIGGVLEQTEHLGGQFVFDLKVDESRDWAEAQATKDLPAYQKYLEAWPIGKHAEAGYWRIACLTDTATAYDLYLERFPQGTWAKEADQQLRAAEELADWQAAQTRDSLSAYRDFLRKHPKGIYAEQARNRQAEIRQRDEEPIEWQKAQTVGTKTAYEAYLRKFSNGPNTGAAREKIAQIERVETQKQQLAEAEARRKAEEKVEAERNLLEREEQKKRATDVEQKRLEAEKIALEQQKQEEVARQETERQAKEKATEKKKEIESLSAKAQAAFDNLQYSDAVDLLEKAISEAVPADRPALIDWKCQIENEHRHQQLLEEAEAAYENANYRLALKRVNQALEYPTRDQQPARQLQALCKSMLSGNWQYLWKNQTFRWGSMALVVIMLIWGIYTVIPSSSDRYEMLMGDGRYQLDSIGDRQSALVLFEQAEQQQSTKEVQTLIKGIKGELDILSSDPTGEIPIPEMKYIEGGTFMMGNSQDQNERPIHEVKVNSFYIGIYEVRISEFNAYARAVGKPSYPGSDELPAYQISWEDARDYCRWLSQQTGRTWRLPTEAEWEYAARGGQVATDTKYAGSNDPEEVAWHYDNANANDSTAHPVAQKKPNELGLYDMSGNVLEWVEDQWYSSYEGAPVDGTAWVGQEKGSYRVIRGGSWGSGAQSCRVSYRDFNSPVLRDYRVGFRLVVSSQ